VPSFSQVKTSPVETTVVLRCCNPTCRDTLDVYKFLVESRYTGFTVREQFWLKTEKNSSLMYMFCLMLIWSQNGESSKFVVIRIFLDLEFARSVVFDSKCNFWIYCNCCNVEENVLQLLFPLHSHVRKYQRILLLL